MSLSPGMRLGPYEVLAPLGAGGMGEVWRARDMRLGREVALKVLPRDVAADPEVRARFDREAKAISQLQHPHACTLFDVGHEQAAGGPIDFLVMELLDGQTLAGRIERGPLPLEQVVTVGRQVAQALAAAHEQGIVHRDLKPGNIMLTRAGAKLLDFGLARQDGGAAGASLLQSAAATESPLTQAGTLVGTWPYLAPEQLRGRPADARSDLFALGAVLYEMITGRRAFPGSTAAEVSAAILGQDPVDPREQVPGTPVALVALLRQCLAKDPAERWQNAGDLARALRLVGETSQGGPGAGEVQRRGRVWPVVLAALGVVAVLAAGLVVLGRRTPAAEPLRFAMSPASGTLLARPTTGVTLGVAPDGRRVVFVATAGGASSLWLWSAEDGEPRRLGGTDGAASPCFSPDGREIAFFAAEELRRISVAGGPPTRIAAAPSATSATWGANGTILFTRWLGPEAGLWSVPAAGGEPRRLAPATGLTGLRALPSFLPDGRHYLFLKGMGGPVGAREACVASVDGGEPDCVTPCDSQAVYAGTGHLVCVRRGTLVAQPFDTKRLRATGEAVTVVPNVRWFGPPGTTSFAVSADGRLLVHEPAPLPSRLAWIDRSGREVGQLGEAARYGQLELRRDGRRVAVEIWSQETGSRDLLSLDVASGVSTRLTQERVDANSGVFSPDGRRVAFGRVAGTPPDVAVRSLDDGRVDVILEAPGIQLPRHWSPDGRLIAYEDFMASRRDQRQVWLLSLDGRRRRFREADSNVYHPRFSPDGRRLAYVSEESGRPEVYVAPVEGSGPAFRLSRAGGLLPRWRGDGRELFFFQPDGMMVSVDPGSEAPPPRLLFHVEGVIAFDFDYDVVPDGQRFLVRLSPVPEGSAGLKLALEWARNLRGPAADVR